MDKHTFYISGTHCASCKILIEDVLGEHELVESVSVSLREEIVEIETSVNISPDELAGVLSAQIKPHGYLLSVGKIIPQKKEDNTTWQALPIGIGFLVLFFLLQKSGVLNLGLGTTATPLAAFLIGLVASVSSCLAIVGGLVLSLSAKVAQDENSAARTPFILFHLSRLFGFAFLGGTLGLVGGAIGINFTFSALLGIVASLVMILLGLNLVGVFHKTSFTLPSGLFSFFRKVEHAVFAPVLLGVGTFFLPCGFTQSMQVAALSSGSFVSGTLIMFAFSVGTLPMLALLSFGSISFTSSRYAPIFFKAAGVVVLGLGIFALLAGLAGLGIIKPLFNI